MLDARGVDSYQAVHRGGMSRQKRRQVLIAGAVWAATPLLVAAQQPSKTWRVGFLSGRARDAANETDNIGPFLQGMRELGYVEAKNVIYEFRFAEGHYGRLPKLAMELVNLQVDVIVAATTPPARAAQRATKKIPIVMVAVADPVSTGLVSSLSRPRGNITGVANYMGDTSQKQIDYLIELVGKPSRIAALLNPDNPATEPPFRSVLGAAQRSGIELISLQVRTPPDIDRAFATARKGKVQALIAIADTFLSQQREQIVRLANEARLPAMFYLKEFAEIGGLMSYGPSVAEMSRRAATYVDKILRGAEPGDLAVEQPTRIELVVNVKTAKAIGVAIPQSILLRADRIIE